MTAYPRSIIVRGVRGGVGTSTVAAALASAAGRAGQRVLLVDAAPDGNLAGVVGIPTPGRATPADAGPGVTLLRTPGGRKLTTPFASTFDVVVYDAGRVNDPVAHLPLTAGQGGRWSSGPTSHDALAVYVGRNDYGSLNAWAVLPHADVNVCVVEPGRALTVDDLRAVMPGATVVPLDHSGAIARAADAGILSARLPSALVELAGELLPAGVAS